VLSVKCLGGPCNGWLVLRLPATKPKNKGAKTAKGRVLVRRARFRLAAGASGRLVMKLSSGTTASMLLGKHKRRALSLEVFEQTTGKRVGTLKVTLQRR
jgi:hypothetical protein